MDRPARDTLFFDGACGLCTRSTRLLRALDWLARLDFIDMTTLPDADLPVPRDAAMKGIPMRTRTGTTLVGYPAMRRALLQTPLGLLPALLMHLPGISHAGRAIYRHIADNRARNAVCSPQSPSQRQSG